MDSLAYNFWYPIGEVLELADRRDLGSRAARREGSSPSFPIIYLNPISQNIRLHSDGWDFFILILYSHVIILPVEVQDYINILRKKS